VETYKTYIGRFCCGRYAKEYTTRAPDHE